MKNTPWMVFDMDEVIVNGRDCLAKHLNQHTGKNILATQWTQYDLCAMYGIEHATLLEIFHSSNMLENAILESDVLAAMTRAKHLNYQVGILTARGWHENGLNLTLATVEKYALPVDHVVAVPLDTAKQDVIEKHFPGGIAGFVDDNPSHIRGVSAIGIPSYVRDRPWNQDLVEFPRVFHLIDFIENSHQRYTNTRAPTSDFTI